MRILQVYMGPYQTNTGGGISVYVRNISERLAKKYDVTVFATNPGNLPRFETVNGVKVERFKRFAPGGAYFFSLEMLLRLRKSCFDVVHGHGYQAFPMHFSVLAKTRRFVVSTHFHGVGHSALRNSLVRLARPFGQRTLRAADAIIAVSQYEKSLICRQFKLDSSKVSVIPCGVDFSEFEGQKREKPEIKSVLYVGRLVSYKGAQLLIDVLPKLEDDVVVEIVGRGPMRPFLESHARKLNVSSRVRFIGNLPRSELVKKFMSSSVFVMPSEHEAYSLVVAEALVAGLPCVLTDTSALSEWLDDKICFRIGFPINLNEFSRVINHALKSAFDKNAFKKRIGTKILDWTDVVCRVEKIYENQVA
jgi:glycosyltransferase involved in cell wall biosynthesis